ncbi:hypothetical protein [Kitasatospora camelliae]|uniref:N-acetylmuramoyl-L-alanine amidase n=1 Tax=Kitasatospora camelliae TaxID=3156397 RepID=A0AAU8K4C3_9ACTN
MTRTGPQRIPGASFDLYFGDGRYSGSDMEVNCVAVHTTEGATLVDYDDGAVAPTVTLVPDFRAQRLVTYQHYDVDESARALVNAPGGVQTNTANVFQIELVGTCDPDTHAKWARAGIQHIYWPAPPDWAVRDLAWLARWLHDNHNIPLTSGLTFKPYPASYGANNGVRLSFAEWGRFTGWLGHQHAPENLHGDPGALPMEHILAVARGEQTTSEEDDMTPDQIAGAPLPYWGPDGQLAGTATLGEYFGGLDLAARATKATLAAIQGQLAAQAATLRLILDQHNNVDTAAVLAAIQAISDDAAKAVQQALAAGVNVHIDVAQTPHTA